MGDMHGAEATAGADPAVERLPGGGAQPSRIVVAGAAKGGERGAVDPNAQGVRAEPRALLRGIPGLELREIADPHLCCGSAGTYNLDQPEIAASLGAQKTKAAAATGATIVATGNIGCLTQLRAHAAQSGVALGVQHTMQVLRDAYAGD